ncbi:MAG: ABC-F family ATPase [Pseudomonadota bacterium]
MISTANLTVQFSTKPLFENVSVKFGDGNRYGLIGANGSGKSTFMKILGGIQESTNGSVTITPGERMAMLGQDQFAFEGYSVVDTVIMGHAELWKIKAERDRLYSLPEMSDEEGIAVAELEVTFAEMDGYTAESRAGELLLGVGIPIEQHFGPMSAVAPGYKLRVLLAQALFADPDILLLDEPTNNLDINTIRWLETTLNERNSTMIIISHDRHFLNSVCTHMADLDYGEIRVYPGNYDDFMLASTQARQRQLANNARKQAQVKELQAFVARFKANKSKARQATSRQKQIEKLQTVEIKPSSRQNPYIRFELDKKLHRNAIEIENLSAAYGEETIIDKLSVMIEAGEKVAIIGPNGIGKTTLLNALMEKGSDLSGSTKWSENADIGYFEQDHADVFKASTSLFDWMTDKSKPEDDEQVVRGVLGRLLFSRDEIGKSVNVVSGGEQGRLLFGQLMLGRHNVMLMDEPTNHLDMESIESLNLALDLYEGTLIFVSHDREFVSSLATRIIELNDSGITDYRGGYDDYLSSQGLD